MSIFNKLFGSKNDSSDIMQMFLQNQSALNSSINYQFSCVGLRNCSFSVDNFNRNYGSTENTTKWIENILNVIKHQRHLQIEKEYYNMPFRFEERDDSKVRAIVIKIPNAKYECECNFVGIVEKQGGIRYFTNELYVTENEFHLCEFMSNGSHRAYSYMPKDFDEFIEIILKI